MTTFATIKVDPRFFVDKELVIVAKGDAYDSSLTFTIKLVGERAACIEDMPGDLDIIKLDEHDFYLTPLASQALEVSSFLENQGFPHPDEAVMIAKALQNAGFLKEL